MYLWPPDHPEVDSHFPRGHLHRSRADCRRGRWGRSDVTATWRETRDPPPRDLTTQKRREVSMFRMVIADHDDVARRRLANAFADEDGLDVVAAVPDGSEALELVRSTRPDVVLVDVDVPPLGGLALVSAVHE